MVLLVVKGRKNPRAEVSKAQSPKSEESCELTVGVSTEEASIGRSRLRATEGGGGSTSTADDGTPSVQSTDTGQQSTSPDE